MGVRIIRIYDIAARQCDHESLWLFFVNSKVSAEPKKEDVVESYLPGPQGALSAFVPSKSIAMVSQNYYKMVILQNNSQKLAL